MRTWLTSIWQRVRGPAQSLEACLLYAMVPVAVLLLMSNAGAYLNNALFFEPTMKLRAQLDLQPELDPGIRVVLFEDRSLEKLGRHPSSAEWYGVAELLFARGYERVFLLGLPDDPKVALSRHAHGRFILGAVATEDTLNSRAGDAGDTPVALLAHSDASGALVPLKRVILPDPPIMSVADALGHQNVLSNYEMPAAYAVGDAHVLPNIGLLVSDDLRWESGNPRLGGQSVPVSSDGTLLIDFVDTATLFERALPFTAFFDTRQNKTREALSAKVLSKLEGGRIAILVPDAYTGARFLDSPTGKVLSYVAITSMINSALRHDFLHRPYATWVYMLLGLPLALALLRIRQSRIALGGTFIAVTALALLCIGLALYAGRVLPCAQLILTISAGFGLRAFHHLMITLSEKLALNKEMQMGSVVQQLLLPREVKGELNGWSYEIVYRPYWAMAGDWFQVFETPPEAPRHVAVIVIGDGLGKGPSAALNTAVIAAVWNSHKETWSQGCVEVDQFVRDLDRTIRATFNGEQSTTLSVAILDGDRAKLLSCAAPSWIHLKASQKEAKNLRFPAANPLGLTTANPEDITLPQLHEVEVHEGDLLIAFSDGVIDGMSATFRFRKQLAKLDLQRADLFAEIERLATETGAADVLPDDFTLLMIRRTPRMALPKSA